jgi:hypothetical protein
MRNPPKHMVIRIRHREGKPMKSVALDGKPHTDFDSVAKTVLLIPAAATQKVRVLY